MQQTREALLEKMIELDLPVHPRPERFTNVIRASELLPPGKHYHTADASDGMVMVAAKKAGLL